MTGEKKQVAHRKDISYLSHPSHLPEWMAELRW
jgi:hypothetical protein